MSFWKALAKPRAARAPVVLISGASCGIGRALALAWAERGATLVLMARRARDLENVADEARTRAARARTGAANRRVYVCVGDVTIDADRRRFIDLALSETERIDVLVNNAGRGYYAATSDIDLAEFEDLFALNVVAPLALTQLAADPLARSGGSVVMISSITGVAATPKLGAYAASKSALEALSISMRAELAPRGVHLLVARPGPVETDFRIHAFRRNTSAPAGDKRQSPEQVAELILRAVEAREPVVETTRLVQLASFAARVFPKALRTYNTYRARHSP
jgi:short-subunit dehydrogenase